MDGEIMQRTLQEADASAQESFEELIAGRCREDFTRKVQQIIDRRFAEHRAKEENWPWRSFARIVDWIGRMRRV